MSGAVDKLDVSDFALTIGTAIHGVWTVTSPITQAQLPLGTYSVTVDATDQGGTTVTGVLAPGTLYFCIDPTITMSASSTVVDYDNQSVTFSGTVTGLYPDGMVAPLASQAITLQAPGAGTVASLSTVADGSFQVSYQPVPSALPTEYWAEVASSSTILAASTSPITVTLHQDPANLTAQRATSAVNYGQQVTLTGTVTYEPGSTWKPLPGTTVNLYTDIFQPPVATATTGADGTFSLQITATSSEQFEAYAGAFPDGTGPNQYFLTSAEVTLPLTVALPVQISAFTAKLSPFGVLSVSGCMSVTTQPSPPFHSTLTVQYSPGSAGPWTSLRVIATGSTACPGAPGSQFAGKVNVKLASAYYRVAYLGAPGYQPAVSAALHESKYLTKITAFTVSPASVARNHYVTVKGRLWQHLRSWKPYAGRKILILFTYRGKLYGYRKEPVTSSAGWFTARLKVLVSAPWFAQYNGDATHFASASKSVRVTATASIPLQLNLMPPTIMAMPGAVERGMLRVQP